MPGRQQIPSFQIASGTTAERDGSYNLTTVGNIFYNTDTSNVEIRHVDPSNSLDWRDLVVNDKEQIDISGELVVNGYIKHNNVRFSAYSTEESITKDGFDDPFNLEKTFYNVGSSYENGVFTAPVTGHYRFTLTIYVLSGGGSPPQAALWYRSSTSSGAARSWPPNNNNGLFDAVRPGHLMGLGTTNVDTPTHGNNLILSKTADNRTMCGVFDVYVPVNYQIAFGARRPATTPSLEIYRAHTFFSGELISPA